MTDQIIETRSGAAFSPGDRVRYIPRHANADRDHPDCEDGVVTSVNDSLVFVLYDHAEDMMPLSAEPCTAKATYAHDLIPLS